MMVSVDSGVQTRMGAISELPQPVPDSAAWQHRHHPALEEPQCEKHHPFAEPQPVQRPGHHGSLGLKARMSREDTAPNS